MNCPVHATKMEGQTGLSAHNPKMREYRYRCEDCDAEFIVDHQSKRLRMIDGREFTNTYQEVDPRKYARL
jgi:transposase-like protein